MKKPFLKHGKREAGKFSRLKLARLTRDFASILHETKRLLESTLKYTMENEMLRVLIARESEDEREFPSSIVETNSKQNSAETRDR